MRMIGRLVLTRVSRGEQLGGRVKISVLLKMSEYGLFGWHSLAFIRGDGFGAMLIACSWRDWYHNLKSNHKHSD